MSNQETRIVKCKEKQESSKPKKGVTNMRGKKIGRMRRPWRKWLKREDVEGIRKIESKSDKKERNRKNGTTGEMRMAENWKTLKEFRRKW